MALVAGSRRIVAEEAVETDLKEGGVVWRPIKSLWIGSMTVASLVLGPVLFSWSAFAVFLVLTAVTLCAGHSVGMHRRLIHNSFDCPRWLEYLLVYLGVLVGMAGPLGMMRQHDLRDWAQRQQVCHDYLCHRRGILTDYFWQCHGDVRLKKPPAFAPENRIQEDVVYYWMEKTWMWQQLPLGVVLFVLGGWDFVVWGIAVRVTVSVTGHWLVGHFAHHDYGRTNGSMSWRVLGASVQGRDVAIAGLVSMGESWHNNHHAFPGSAKIGLLPGQPDPGWWLIKGLERLGLAWNIVTPQTMPERAELIRLQNDGTGCPVCSRLQEWWARSFSIWEKPQ